MSIAKTVVPLRTLLLNTFMRFSIRERVAPNTAHRRRVKGQPSLVFIFHKRQILVLTIDSLDGHELNSTLLAMRIGWISDQLRGILYSSFGRKPARSRLHAIS